MDKRKIGKDYYYGSTLVWNKAGGRTERNSRAKANILATEEDMQRIEKFCGKMNGIKANGGSTYTGFRVPSQ